MRRGLISTAMMEAIKMTLLTWTWVLSLREIRDLRDSLVLQKALKVRLAETEARAELMAEGSDENLRSFDTFQHI